MKTYGHTKYSREEASEILLQLDPQMRAALQKVLLSMYLDLLSVCKKYGLTPFLCGGSCLGAIRHKGFIPWDDDLDVAMFRSDFEVLVTVFEKELGDKYILSASNIDGGEKAKQRFPKILKKESVLREVIDVQETKLHKVFIDVFLIDNVPNNSIQRTIKGIKCNILEYIAGEEFIYQNIDEVSKKLLMSKGKKNYFKHIVIGKLFSFLNYSKWFDLVDKSVRYSDESTKFVALTTGRYHYFGEIMKREDVFPPSAGVFEGFTIPLFAKPEIYLKNLYGDYMWIPPESERESHFIRSLSI